MNTFIRALGVAADLHKHQHRKGSSKIPYINHPIKVCDLLLRIGGIQDEITLSAAMLHDTIEDTQATFTGLESVFGTVIASVVLEVSDDKSLSKEERKRLQITHAPLLSHAAKLIKLADKIANMQDIIHHPLDWSVDRKVAYFSWAKQVVDAGLRNVNPALEVVFNDVYFQKQFIK
jgi:guanosine-3',5'-bis(diphosphate) 3'-pyrophosphohydrolase